MNAPSSHPVETVRHPGPPLGLLATVFTVLFLASLYPVTVFAGRPFFPGPYESAQAIETYFQQRPSSVAICAFLHFGASVALGLFTANVVSQLRFLGVRAAGTLIALFGGLATSLNMSASAFVLWVMAYPGIAQDATLLRALYYLQFVFGGPGFSVPMGLLIAGVSITSGLAKLLPKWVVGLGIALAIFGELSWFNLVAPKALFLVPLTRFPGFVWIVAVGFLLPNTISRAASPARERPA